MSDALVHYRAISDDSEVVCGARPSSLDFTRVFGMVTCFACRRHPTFRLDQLGLDDPTDVRPSVPLTDRAILRRVKQVLAEWEQGVHSDADALSIIKEITDKKGPDHG